MDAQKANSCILTVIQTDAQSNFICVQRVLGTLCLMMIVYVVGTGDQLYPPQLAYPAQAAFPGRVHHSHCQG